MQATAVAFERRGVLICGPPGSGKSTLALELMAYGAELIADDRVMLRNVSGQLELAFPEGATTGIEARTIGILKAEHTNAAIAKLIVDLVRSETERLPEIRKRCLCGVELDLVYGAGNPCLAPAIIQFLKAGRWE